MKVSHYLYFNGTMRFFMEGYMDFVLFALVNTRDMDWSGDFFTVTVNNWISLALLGISFAFPALIMIIYVFNAKKWNQESFKNRYGTLVDNTNLEMRQSQWVILLVPLSYVLRRIAMCLCLVFWIEFFWGQIAVQVMATVFVIILLQWSRPL